MNSRIEMGIHPDEDGLTLEGELSMGDEKRKMSVVVDTGSSVLFVQDEMCGEEMKRQCGDNGKREEMRYLDGSVEGSVCETSVWFDQDRVESKGHTYLKVDDARGGFNSGKGMLGLARGYSDTEFQTFVQTLKQNGVVEKAEFSIFKSKEGDFNLVFGELDEGSMGKVEKESTSQILGVSKYYVASSNLKIYDQSISSATYRTLIDTGNSLISMPEELKESIIQSLNSRGFECHVEVESNAFFSQLYCDKSRVDEGDHFELNLEIGGIVFGIRIREDGCHESDESVFDIFGWFTEDNLCAYGMEFQHHSNDIILGKQFFEDHLLTFDIEDNTLRIIRLE